MAEVALIRCETYNTGAVRSAVNRVFEELGGIEAYIKPGDKVLLKPNLLSAHSPEECITTHPVVVNAVAMLVLEAGGKPFIGDSPALESFKRVALKTGMRDVAKEMEIGLVELSGAVSISLPLQSRFKRIEIASQVLEADVVINLPKLKTHSQMLLTLGVKNLFGTIVAQRKAEWHHMAGVNRDTFASLLLDIYQGVSPALTILDGIWAMEGRGPSNGTIRALKLISASPDAIALDVMICSLLGVPLPHFPLYRVARERQIGETDLTNIVFKGDNIEVPEIRDFQVPKLDSLNLIPSIFDWFTKRYLVSKPLQDSKKCLRCGQCVEICPEKAIVLNDDQLCFDYDSCIRCYCCQEICPEDAIYFHKGLLLSMLNRFNR